MYASLSEADQGRVIDAVRGLPDALNMTRPLIAIVVPVFNERDNLRPFHEAVTGVMRSLADYDWEFVFVDDGSRRRVVRGAGRAARPQDDRVTALRFPRNFGSHVAIAAGIDYCRGDAAVVMAADLQDPPALIRDFVERWRDGFDVVWGARTGRDDGALRAWAMAMFYRAGPAVRDSDVSRREARAASA